MRWIKFSVKCWHRDGSATFDAGATYELEDASAERWVRRNKATYVDGPDKVPVTVAPETAMVEPAEMAVKPQGRPRKLK